MVKFDEKGKLIKEGIIEVPFEIVAKDRNRKGKRFERSYLRLDPRG